jgi:hypothetical protein
MAEALSCRFDIGGEGCEVRLTVDTLSWRRNGADGKIVAHGAWWLSDENVHPMTAILWVRTSTGPELLTMADIGLSDLSLKSELAFLTVKSVMSKIQLCFLFCYAHF